MNLVNIIFLVALLFRADDSEPILKRKRSITRSRYNSRERILWIKPNLTYSLFGNIAANNQTKMSAIRKALRESFAEWELNSCFKFKEITPDYSADIKIVFTNDRLRYSQKRVENPFLPDYTHHNCERQFRGSAAHAFFRYNTKFPAHIHVNNEVFWMESNSPSGSVSLKTVFLHEIGHVLGLFHTVDLNSVMYQYIFTNRIQSISQTDRNDLNELYMKFCEVNGKRKKE